MGAGARFTLGLVAGFILASTALHLGVGPDLSNLQEQFRAPGGASGELATWSPAELWAMTERNLRGSVVPFLLVLAYYLYQLRSLLGLLGQQQPALAQVLRREQLLDLCASLCFGIGVIWTAIGMRGALLYALGETGDVAAGSGQAVLQRLVDGGILLALSTTIVGGIGGYLMRTGKQLLCGQTLSALYLRESERTAQHHLDALRRIESALSGQPAPTVENQP